MAAVCQRDGLTLALTAAAAPTPAAAAMTDAVIAAVDGPAPAVVARIAALPPVKEVKLIRL